MPARPSSSFGQTETSAIDEEQLREGEQQVHHPADHRVDPAAEVAGDDAEDDAEDDGDQGGEEGDQQRDPRAVDDPAEHVAAVDRLDAEEEVPADAAAGARSGVPKSGSIWSWWNSSGGWPNRLDDQRGEDRDERQEEDDDAAGQRDLVPLEPRPGDRPSERPSTDRLAAACRRLIGRSGPASARRARAMVPSSWWGPLSTGGDRPTTRRCGGLSSQGRSRKGSFYETAPLERESSIAFCDHAASTHGNGCQP